MTRVLMFCSQFHPIIGGAEEQARRLAERLRDQGVDVLVVTPRLVADSPPHENVGGVPVVRFPLTDIVAASPVKIRGLGVPNTLVQGLQIHRAIRRHLADRDLLHIHLASAAASFATRVAQLLGKPSICKIACGGEGFDFIELDHTSLLGPRLRRRMIGAMTRWIAISSEIEDDLVQAGVDRERIVRIPNGIDPTIYPVRDPRIAIEHFLYLGRLEKCDVETLIEAFARHAAKYPRSRLRIAGKGDPGPARRALQARPELGDRVELPGFVQAADAYAWADAVVHPSRAEGLANTLLEALCMGIPCVASDIAPNAEVLGGGKAGLLHAPADAEALAGCMDALAGTPTEAAGVGRAGTRRILEVYDIGEVARSYASLYSELTATSEIVRAVA